MSCLWNLGASQLRIVFILVLIPGPDRGTVESIPVSIPPSSYESELGAEVTVALAVVRVLVLVQATDVQRPEPEPTKKTGTEMETSKWMT
jgi:hypothetical protein